MSEINENKPRRRRVVRGGEGLLATSNETKMKTKARVVEKPVTPLFGAVKTEKVEAIPEPEVHSEQVNVIQYANPLPVEVAPKPRRGRQPKAPKVTEPVEPKLPCSRDRKKTPRSPEKTGHRG